MAVVVVVVSAFSEGVWIGCNRGRVGSVTGALGKIVGHVHIHIHIQIAVVPKAIGQGRGHSIA